MDFTTYDSKKVKDFKKKIRRIITPSPGEEIVDAVYIEDLLEDFKPYITREIAMSVLFNTINTLDQQSVTSVSVGNLMITGINLILDGCDVIMFRRRIYWETNSAKTTTVGLSKPAAMTGERLTFKNSYIEDVVFSDCRNQEFFKCNEKPEDDGYLVNIFNGHSDTPREVADSYEYRGVFHTSEFIHYMENVTNGKVTKKYDIKNVSLLK